MKNVNNMNKTYLQKCPFKKAMWYKNDCVHMENQEERCFYDNEIRCKLYRKHFGLQTAQNKMEEQLLEEITQ